MDHDHDLELGPTERAARTFLGPRPEGVSESTYLYAVRELVDMSAATAAKFRSESNPKGA